MWTVSGCDVVWVSWCAPISYSSDSISLGLDHFLCPHAVSPPVFPGESGAMSVPELTNGDQRAACRSYVVKHARSHPNEEMKREIIYTRLLSAMTEICFNLCTSGSSAFSLMHQLFLGIRSGPRHSESNLCSLKNKSSCINQEAKVENLQSVFHLNLSTTTIFFDK